MAYQTFFYRDRLATQRMADSDTIGDAELPAYPAPTGNEVAFARHSENPELHKWGYDGGWHDQPPPEVAREIAREKEESRQQEAANRRAQKRREDALARARDKVARTMKYPVEVEAPGELELELTEYANGRVWRKWFSRPSQRPVEKSWGVRELLMLEDGHYYTAASSSMAWDCLRALRDAAA